MRKFLLALTLLCVAASPGALAHSGTDQEQQACDFTILACLKENRQKLSTACRDVLVSHGQ